MNHDAIVVKPAQATTFPWRCTPAKTAGWAGVRAGGEIPGHAGIAKKRNNTKNKTKENKSNHVINKISCTRVSKKQTKKKHCRHHLTTRTRTDTQIISETLKNKRSSITVYHRNYISLGACLKNRQVFSSYSSI